MTGTTLVNLAGSFWGKVDRSGGSNACWPWKKALTEGGYGVVAFGRKKFRAHRVAYLLANGSFPAEDTDHTCHNGSGCTGGPTCRHRACCNPRHLEDVPRRVNRNRGNSENVRGSQASRTHCPRAHEYTPENTWLDKHGYRYCRACNRLNQQRRRANRQEAAA